jgi:uncharacterized OB-fold protein
MTQPEETARSRAAPFAVTPPGAPARALPLIDKDNKAFWTGGEQGELRIYRCQACRYYVHPPVRFCPKCESRDVEPEAVSGRGSVTSFTVNHQPWVPGLPERFVLALVSIAEQDDVRLVSNIVNCPPDSVTMGMPVKVLFEQHEDLWVPFFEPEAN